MGVLIYQPSYQYKLVAKWIDYDARRIFTVIKEI